jgi:hypothetical protein
LLLAEMDAFGKMLFGAMWLVRFVGPVIVLAALIWLVHTIWKYRHIPPRS